MAFQIASDGPGWGIAIDSTRRGTVIAVHKLVSCTSTTGSALSVDDIDMIGIGHVAIRPERVEESVASIAVFQASDLAPVLRPEEVS